VTENSLSEQGNCHFLLGTQYRKREGFMQKEQKATEGEGGEKNPK